MSVLDLDYNFAGLSLQDLLEARDLYHWHLLSKPNVVGTAIGYYLIRKEEAWPSKPGEGRNPPAKKSYARTLFNSEVRDYSWPCILAFVRQWEPRKAFAEGGARKPSEIVPKTLYMPDGRAVPVCVVEVGDEQPVAALPPVDGPRPSFPLGGGCPIKLEAQGERRSATAGCLVTDGHTTYVLTARHACGESGQVVSSVLREGEERIGVTAGKQLKRLEFSTVYPRFPGGRAYSALDVGLVRVDRVADWTSNTYGLPALGPLADVHEGNLSLRLIDQPVVGYGAASGLLRGSIKALFYRHRSVGGFDYVADFMIAPGDGVQTRPGDSGMVWHLDVTPNIRNHPDLPVSQRTLRPLAMEWGGQVIGDGATTQRFAVATSLSSICRLLDVELVTDVGRGVSGYWGRTGHYSIAALAIEHVHNTKLKKFLRANAAILSFDLGTIAQTGFDKSVGQLSSADSFVPLADVPDEIWKKLSKPKGGRTGGRDTTGGAMRSNGPEHPNHYADIDAPGPNGKSLLDLCREDPDTHLTPDAWLQFYADMAKMLKAAGRGDEAKQYTNKLKQGLLPFRLWQFFDAMVGFVQDGDIEGYLTAAGTAAHYVGDASQPLHGSVMADGNHEMESPRIDPETNEPFIYGKGIHSAYETKMVSRYAEELIQQAGTMLSGAAQLPACKSGAQYARAVIELMHIVAKKLPPQKILDEFEEAGGESKVATLDAMYEKLGKPTSAVLAEGARFLALLWESAWAAGGGAQQAAAGLVALNKADIRKRYIKTNFVPSVTLDEIGDHLTADGAPASGWSPAGSA